MMLDMFYKPGLKYKASSVYDASHVLSISWPEI